MLNAVSLTAPVATAEVSSQVDRSREYRWSATNVAGMTVPAPAVPAGVSLLTTPVPVARGQVEPVDYGCDTRIPLKEIRSEARAVVLLTADAVKGECMAERETLLQKKYQGGGLNPKETRRLAYVCWRLDRVDDAENGPALDRLEDLARLHNQFRREMGVLLSAVQANARQ